MLKANASRTPAPAGPAGKRSVGADHPISVVQANSLPALVQRELERMILDGDLPAGAKVTEASIAELLGVSRGPVREAFRALEGSGLVRFEKNRGVSVRQISVEEADQIYELRAVLDEFVGRRLAQTATSADLQDMRQKLDYMEKAAARNDVDAYLAANLDFHDRLVELANNPKLLSMYRRLVNELHLFRRTTLAQGGTLPISTREHREIIDRIAARQPAAAGRALFDHVMASRSRMHKTYDAPREAREPASARGGRRAR